MALEQLTVLDLTQMLTGLSGSMLRADSGPRTIKVELTESREGTCRLLKNDPNLSIQSMGAYFLTRNRNKQSVCFDRNDPRGLAVFKEWVKHMDFVIDNFSVDVTRRLGIDQECLAGVNLQIVTSSMSGQQP